MGNLEKLGQQYRDLIYVQNHLNREMHLDEYLALEAKGLALGRLIAAARSAL
jgi:hypothetical protein